MPVAVNSKKRATTVAAQKTPTPNTESAHKKAMARDALKQTRADIEKAVAKKPRSRRALTKLTQSAGFKNLDAAGKERVLHTAMCRGADAKTLKCLHKTVNTKHYHRATATQRAKINDVLAATQNLDETTAAYEKLLNDDHFNTVPAKRKLEVLSRPRRFAAAKNPYARPRTVQNERFVQKFGFSDLPNDAVRQYRDKTEALFAAVKKIDRQDPRFSCMQNVKDLVKKAGRDPKAREQFELFYRIVVQDKAPLSATDVVQLARVVGKVDARGLSRSKAARQAAVCLARNKAYARSSAIQKWTPEILFAAAAAKPKPKRMERVVSAMVHYLGKARKPAVSLAVSRAVLAKLDPTKTPAPHDIYGDLQRIASARKPQRSAQRCLDKLSDAQRNTQWAIRKRVTTRYVRVLKQHTNLRGRKALRVAQKIYDLGGPRTYAGVYILAAIKAKSDVTVSPRTLSQWMGKVSGQMLGDTHGLQGGKLRCNIAEMQSRGKVAAHKRGWIAKINTYSDAVAASQQALDTAVAVAELCGASGGLAAASTVVGLAVSVVSIPLTLAEVGYQSARFKKDEAAQFAARGDRAAEQIARSYTDRAMPSLELAYRMGKQGENGTYGAKSSEAFKAHKKQFIRRYRFLQKMTPNQRKRFFEAKDFVHTHLSA